ncbi:hypothetical protein BsWGS_19166 [Bradybaena similaris]
MGGTRGPETFPVDGGYAWFICLGGFITHVVLGSAGQTTSVLFVELVQRFDTTITTASLIFMCHVIAFSFSTVMSPIFILPRLRERWTLVLGGCLLCTATVGCSLSPTIGVFIAFSVLKGTASGCVFVPCSSLIRIYFKKRQSTASVVAYCGGSVAAIVAPFVVRAVRREFGISGAYLILAGVELNVCVAGMLMRPVTFYQKTPEEPREDTDIIREHGLLSTDIKAEFPSADKVFLEKGEFNIFNHQWNRQASVTCRSDQLPTIEEDALLSGKLPNKRSHEKVSTAGSISSVPPKSPSEFAIGSGLQATRQQPSHDSLVFISGENLAVNDKGLKPAGSTLSAHSEVMKCASVGDTSEKPVFVSCANAEELLKSQAYQVLIEQEKCLLSRELSIDERPKAPYGSVFTLASEAGRAIEVLLIEEMTSMDGRRGMSRWRHMYDKSSLGLWSFRMTLIAALPGTVNQYLVAYLPTISNALGATFDEAANLVTIMGAVDLVSRLGMGLIADTKVLPPSRMLAIAQISMGTVCQFVWTFTSFPLLILMVILMGLFVGSRVSLLPLVCTEVVGSERMPQAYSIAAMSTALVGAMWSPVLGIIAESANSFLVVMHFIGTGFVLSGLLMLTLAIFTRHENKREPSVENDDNKNSDACSVVK